MVKKRPLSLQAAAQRKYKGKYIGPDKYKGIIPKHLQHKYKGKYFGKEKYGGLAKNAPFQNVERKTSTAPRPDISKVIKGVATKQSNLPTTFPNRAKQIKSAVSNVNRMSSGSPTNTQAGPAAIAMHNRRLGLRPTK